MIRLFVRYVLCPKWVVYFTPDEKPELGLSVFGVVIGLYKGETYYPKDVISTRKPEKREFGESLHP